MKDDRQIATKFHTFPSQTLRLLDRCPSIFARCRSIIAAINVHIYKTILRFPLFLRNRFWIRLYP